MIAYVLVVSSLSLVQTCRYIFTAHLILVDHRDFVRRSLGFALVAHTFKFSDKTRWIDPLLNALISCLIRLFYIHRIWRMTNKWWVPAPLVLVQLGICVAQGWLVAGVYLHHERRYVTVENVAFDLAIIGSTVLDLVLASILGYLVLNSRTGVRYLDKFLERIAIFFWSCAIPPALLMIPAVVIYHVATSRLAALWCTICIATSIKLYHHSLLRSLNSRDRHQKRLQHEREAFNDANFRSDISQSLRQELGGTAADTDRMRTSVASTAVSHHTVSVPNYSLPLNSSKTRFLSSKSLVHNNYLPPTLSSISQSPTPGDGTDFPESFMKD